MTIQLAPEIEAGLRRRATDDGVAVEDVVTRAVDAYLRRPAPGPVRRVPTRDRRQEMAWAAHPDPAFFGQWVVLEGSSVVASGTDATLVCEEARGKGITTPFLTFVPSKVEDHFAGGWL